MRLSEKGPDTFLGALWLAQTARVMANSCVCLYVMLELIRAGQSNEEIGWQFVVLLFLMPAVLLAPLVVALCNSLSKRLLLVGAAVFCMAIVGLAQLLHAPWVVGWALIACGSAVFGPTCLALLPAAARDSRRPLTRINALFELGTALAIVAGFLFGADGLFLKDGQAWTAEGQALPSPPILVIVLYLAALATAVLVWFPSDVCRPLRPGPAVTGFFRDSARIWRAKELRGALLGLSLSRGLLAAMLVALLAGRLTEHNSSWVESLHIVIRLFGGIAVGSMFSGLQRNPHRALGLIPWGATGIAIGLVVAGMGSEPNAVLCVVWGAMIGLATVPLAALYQATLPPDSRGNGMALLGFAVNAMAVVMGGLLFFMARWFGLAAWEQLWIIAALGGLVAVAAWWWFLREAIEQIMEFLIWPFYRIHGYGPGLTDFPMQGPVLVVANHSAWFDPIWVAKIMPRRLIPIMTSVFFDLPGMRWLMVHLAKAIRVQASTYRRHVPEIAEAVAALDRGEVVMIYPEGSMRRRLEAPLRQFGRGVWHILRERPTTPVFVCWIEGGWGSYFSYWNGPPTKNKKMDFRRRIDIGVRAGQVLNVGLLEDQRATRTYLMQQCLEARAILGLEVPRLRQIEDVEAGKDEKETSG